MARWFVRAPVTTLGAESLEQSTTLKNAPERLENGVELRRSMLNFIADFSKWENSVSEPYLEACRALTNAAHEALGKALGGKPMVLDPFAGGGAIPLEALRAGADAFASDVNPVAAALNRVLLQYIPKYGQRLADEARKWGAWMRGELRRELGEAFPDDPDGATPVAYLWARTIHCEGPGCGALVPLIRNMQLTRNRRRWYLAFEGTGDPERKEIRVVVKEGDAPSDRPPASGGSATCPRRSCGYTTPAAAVRDQLARRCGGARDAVPIAVLIERPSGGRAFRSVKEGDLQGSAWASEVLDEAMLPRGQINPVRPYKNTRGLSAVTRIGIRTFDDLYTPRQALVIQAMQKTLQRVGDEAWEPDFRRAVLTVLNCAVSRFVFQNCSLSRWHVGRSTIEGAFGKQALQVVWDFAEANPLSNGPANWLGAVGWVAKVIERNRSLVDPGAGSGSATQAPAQKQVLPDDSADALVTDPPYFAAIPYADLSNVFYVWERRFFKEFHPDLLANHLVDQRQEIIVTDANEGDGGRRKTPLFFREEMTKALRASRRVVKDSGVGVVVFADSSVESWDAILGAIMDAGWIISGSWPIDTEHQNRTRAAGTASLQSSIHIVCRPRRAQEEFGPEVVGEWREVLEELPRRIAEWMPRLAQEGIVGADAIFSCLGPALEIFSRYHRVEKASGEPVGLPEFMEHVWAAVSEEALSVILEDADLSGFEPDARLTAMWLWTLSSSANGHASGGDATATPSRSNGYELEYDAARKIAQGLGAHLERLDSVVAVRGEVARLLPVSERASTLLGDDAALLGIEPEVAQLDMFDEPKDASSGSTSGRLALPEVGDTTLDRVHQAMLLFAGESGDSLRSFLLEEGVGREQRFWQLAQALSVLYPASTDEKRWVDGVLARKRALGL